MNASRVGDNESGTCDLGLECCPHGRGGTISTGARDVYTNNRIAAILGSTGGCNCAHGGSFRITSGSSTVFINNRKAARITDSTVCMSCGMGGAVISGSNNVFIGG